MQPFAPRPITFHGLREPGGWRLKLYSIRYGSTPLDWSAFEAGIRMAEAALPEPAIANGRPGLGFVIAHQGRTGAYVVLGWWDQENEMPLHVFVRRGHGDPWRRAIDGESVCVWDLEVLWAEREAYVHSMLRADGGDPAAYLGRVLERE